jgi:hypothetical protein
MKISLYFAEKDNLTKCTLFYYIQFHTFLIFVLPNNFTLLLTCLSYASLTTSKLLSESMKLENTIQLFERKKRAPKGCASAQEGDLPKSWPPARCQTHPLAQLT